MKTREEKLQWLKENSKPSTTWKKDAERRMRQRWWKKHWNVVLLKWLRIKRKLKGL